MAVAHLVLGVALLAGAAAIAFRLSLRGNPGRTRRLVPVEASLALGGLFAISFAFLQGAGAVLLGLGLGSLFAVGSLLDRYCTACGHRERWSRILEAPRHCSYCAEPVAPWWRLPRA